MKGWETVPLAEASLFLNRGIAPKYLEQGGICILNQKCVRNHTVGLNPARRHDHSVKSVAKDRLIRRGDVLVNSTGTGTLGRVAQLRADPEEPTTVDSHVTIVRPDLALFDLDFFGYAMIAIEEEIKQAGEGCGGQTELARDVLGKRFFVRYPKSKDTQRRIVGILDEAFAGLGAMRANAEKNSADSQALLKASLRETFTVALANSERKTLAEVAKEFGRGKSRHRPRGDPKLLGGRYAFIQTGDVANAIHEIETYTQTYNEFGLAQSKLWPKGTVCIAIVGANVAETAILGFDACFPDSVIGLVPDPSRADADFIQFLLTAHKEILKEKGKGTARDNINMASFEEERFPLPGVQRQRQIAIRLKALAEGTDKFRDVTATKLAAIDELRASLLHQAFSGNL